MRRLLLSMMRLPLSLAFSTQAGDPSRPRAVIRDDDLFVIDGPCDDGGVCERQVDEHVMMQTDKESLHGLLKRLTRLIMSQRPKTQT